MSSNNHGGRRQGAGRRPGLTDTEKARKEAEFQKFKYMSELSDKEPIYQLSIEVPCQTDKCFNKANQGLWQMRGNIYSIRPICKICIQMQGHADVVESNSKDKVTKDEIH